MTDARRDWTTEQAEAFRAGERAGIERAAAYVDCACGYRDAVLAAADERGPNSGRRWRSCGSEPCSALEARAIRALLTEGEAHG